MNSMMNTKVMMKNDDRYPRLDHYSTKDIRHRTPWFLRYLWDLLHRPIGRHYEGSIIREVPYEQFY
jgi:hypothetical protein